MLALGEREPALDVDVSSIVIRTWLATLTVLVAACASDRERDCERVHLVLDMARLHSYAPTRADEPVEKFKQLALRDPELKQLVRDAIDNPALDPNGWRQMYTPHAAPPAVPSFHERLAALCPR